MSLTSAALTIAFHGGTNGRGRLKRSPARLTGGGQTYLRGFWSTGGTRGGTEYPPHCEYLALRNYESMTG